MAIGYGGGQTAVFGLMIASAVQWIVLLGLAELCSALPSSGVCSSIPTVSRYMDHLSDGKLAKIAGSIPFHVYCCPTVFEELRRLHGRHI